MQGLTKAARCPAAASARAEVPGDGTSLVAAEVSAGVGPSAGEGLSRRPAGSVPTILHGLEKQVGRTGPAIPR